MLSFLVISLDAFGLRLVHGEIPGSMGRYGCVISHIFAGILTETSNEIHEGDEVVEINRGASINYAGRRGGRGVANAYATS